MIGKRFNRVNSDRPSCVWECVKRIWYMLFRNFTTLCNTAKYVETRLNNSKKKEGDYDCTTFCTIDSTQIDTVSCAGWIKWLSDFSRESNFVHHWIHLSEECFIFPKFRKSIIRDRCSTCFRRNPEIVLEWWTSFSAGRNESTAKQMCFVRYDLYRA